MPKRFGIFTDVHARGDTPEGRTDNFRVSLFKKLEEVGEIWKNHEIKDVLFVGDLFHTPDPANGVVNEMIRMLISWDVNIYGVIGSHDYFGYQLATLESTALGILSNSGLIKLIGGKGFPAFEQLPLNVQKGTNIIITGTPHTYKQADDPAYLHMPKYGNPSDFQIQLVHCDLYHKHVPWPHVLIVDVHTESQLVLSGHIHTGWNAPIKIGNTTFVNPGAIARLENTGIQRVPRVCILDVYDNLTFKIEYIELESGKNHPFKEKLIVSDKNEIMQDVSKLLNLIDTKKVEMIDIKARLPEVAKQMGFTDDVLIIAFELLEAAK
jgi:DNA repair exonuclease SbcCD nuclease subunit